MDRLEEIKAWRARGLYSKIAADRIDWLIEQLETALSLIEKACATGEDGSPVKYGEYDGDGNYVLPGTLPNIPKLEGERDKARERAEKEESQSAQLRDEREALRKENAELRERIERLQTSRSTLVDQLTDRERRE